MPTWTEVREHLQRTLMITVNEPAWLGITWSFKDARAPEAADVLQRQRVELVQAVGEPHVLLISDIVEVDRAQPFAMLAHNMTLAIGSIATSEGWYVMRQVVHLPSLDLDYFSRSLQFFAREATRLRSLIPAS